MIQIHSIEESVMEHYSYIWIKLLNCYIKPVHVIYKSLWPYKLWMVYMCVIELIHLIWNEIYYASYIIILNWLLDISICDTRIYCFHYYFFFIYSIIDLLIFCFNGEKSSRNRKHNYMYMYFGYAAVESTWSV